MKYIGNSFIDFFFYLAPLFFSRAPILDDIMSLKLSYWTKNHQQSYTAIVSELYNIILRKLLFFFMKN